MKKKLGITKKARESMRQKRLSHRLQCVRLVHGGKSASEVARKTGDSPRMVSYWVTRFEKSGIKGLEDARTRAGAKSKLSPVQSKKVRAFILDAQSKSIPLTGNLLSQHVKKTFGISLSRQHCRRIINAIATS
jgi:transposase